MYNLNMIEKFWFGALILLLLLETYFTYFVYFKLHFY